MGVCTSFVSKTPLPISGGRVGLLKIEGTILMSDDIVEDIKNAEENSALKAVVIRIDSPGGAVAASQEIFEEVKKLNAKKPVVVSMGDVAASGGYYIACGASKILANKGTVTGSIGVRMTHVNLGELLSWAKIDHTILKSGKYKDIGAFDRPMRDDERALLESVLADMHKQFKETVSSARGILAEKVEEIADGRVYTGAQAKELGLIDDIGGLTDAINLAGSLGGIKGKPKVYRVEHKKSWLKKLLFEESLSKVGHWFAAYVM